MRLERNRRAGIIFLIPQRSAQTLIYGVNPRVIKQSPLSSDSPKLGLCVLGILLVFWCER
jgi:hypothetical protein